MSIAGVILLRFIWAVFVLKLGIWNKLAISVLVCAVGNVAIAFMLGRILHEGNLGI